MTATIQARRKFLARVLTLVSLTPACFVLLYGTDKMSDATAAASATMHNVIMTGWIGVWVLGTSFFVAAPLYIGWRALCGVEEDE